MGVPVDVSAVRDAVAARAASLSGWTESIWHPDLFPGQDPGTVAHQAFAVAVPTTENVGGRAVGGRAALVQTPVNVRFTVRLTPKDQRDAFNAALVAEKALLDHLMATGWAADFALVWRGSDRSLPPGLQGWQLVQLRLQATHYLSL